MIDWFVRCVYRSILTTYAEEDKSVHSDMITPRYTQLPPDCCIIIIIIIIILILIILIMINAYDASAERQAKVKKQREKKERKEREKGDVRCERRSDILSNET